MTGKALLLSKKLKTPLQVQKFLKSMPYNHEEAGETLHSAQTALIKKKAHCFEATFIAAAILEHHGYRPLILTFQSKDLLDHVIYIFKEKNKWGAIARSRDEGLHGRPPLFRSIRDLVWSYFEPYVDNTGRILGYQIANLDDIGTDWRYSKKNIWRAEKYLNDLNYIKLKSSDKTFNKYYKAFKKRGHPPRKEFWW